MTPQELAELLFDAWREEWCNNRHFDPIVGPSEWLAIAERVLEGMTNG